MSAACKETNCGFGFILLPAFGLSTPLAWITAPDRPVSIEKVAAGDSPRLKGKDVLPDLVANDDRYLAMPNVGDTADLTFPVPPSPRRSRPNGISP